MSRIAADVSVVSASSSTRRNDPAGVSKVDTPDPVVVGNNITYTISFTNNGPSAATNVTVAENARFVELTLTRGPDPQLAAYVEFETSDERSRVRVTGSCVDGAPTFSVDSRTKG